MLQLVQKLSSLRQGFSKTFWVSNVLELFERFAFYGSKAILVVFLVQKLSLTPQASAALAGFYTGLMYTLPLVSGLLIDRYGFKPTLAACFALFTVGYLLVALPSLPLGASIASSDYLLSYTTAALVLSAVAGSLIKPATAGIVTKTASPEYQSLGYSIFYTVINIGGALGPLFALIVHEAFGIEYVLVMAACVTFCLLLVTLLFFEEPIRYNQEKEAQHTLKDVAKNTITVFKNVRFMSFLTIFSGFYIMFWQLFYSFPFYVLDVLKYERFELLETVNAATIIFVSVPMGMLVKNWSANRAIIAGMLLCSCAWLFMGAVATVPATILSIMLFAIGEATLNPKFYSHVASLAPRNQIGTYMGFAFIPPAIGCFVGGPLGGWLVTQYLKDSFQPMVMWNIVFCIGAVTSIMLALHSRLGEVGIDLRKPVEV